jgi:hypothetical protein
MQAQVRKIVGLIVESGLALPNELLGCSDKEISEIEAAVFPPLPLAYKWFLKTMGKGAGEFLVGEDVFYPKMLGLKSAAMELMQSLGRKWNLPDKAIVFLGHQGYQFLFFERDTDDPEVSLLLDSEPEARKVFDSFSEWLYQCVNDEAAILKRIRGGC